MKAPVLLGLEAPLLRDFERDPKGTGVARILSDYARAHADWRDFALFDSATYTRNLIVRNTWFEMLLLCWNKGQSSPIHNHAGQNCWMAVLEGEIEEQQFDSPTSARSACHPQGAPRVFLPGKVAFINDDIALHRVRPRAGNVGISLHLYSRPIDACNIYEESTGTVVSRSLSYHSVRGARVLV